MLLDRLKFRDPLSGKQTCLVTYLVPYLGNWLQEDTTHSRVLKRLTQRKSLSSPFTLLLLVI